LTEKDLAQVLLQGACFMLDRGVGEEADLDYCESSGHLHHAQTETVSDHAKERGKDQLGTLGSGNHFLEVQVVDEIFDHARATTFGIREGCLTAMIHCGSRGLGHQVCTDHVRIMLNALKKFGINNLVDRQLACAPFLSKEGQDYFSAMSAAANFAWANRHLIGQKIRAAFIRTFGRCVVRTVYDVAHNIGKLETHCVDDVFKKMIVHRKGATCAFGPKQSDVTPKYQATGQPVLIPGTMGTASYVLAGCAASMDLSFGSACHGAGRIMSRQRAKKQQSGQSVRDALRASGIAIYSDSGRGLAEEAPYAYKDVHEVISVISGAGIATKVAKLSPVAVVKGD
jgi:tRNA-splicing ligase RtcB